MATAASDLMTADEFFDFCQRPENRDRHFELEQGRVVEMSLPGERHGVVCGNASWILGTYARQRRKGFVLANDAGLIVERDPDTVRGPDIFFYDEVRRFDELNIKYTDRPPKLIIEVLSPNDTTGKMLRRVLRFLSMGVPLVCIIDPEEKILTVVRSGKPSMDLTPDQEVTGEDVLPDLRCKVADFFTMPGE
jgi:Uma2 family endonuclease